MLTSNNASESQRVRRIFSSLSLRFLAVAGFLCLGGCADDGLVPLYGKVLVDGTAAPKGVSLEFIPTDKSLLPCSAETNDRGEFAAQFTFRKTGVQPGEYTARLLPGSTLPSQDASATTEQGSTDMGETPKPGENTRPQPRRRSRQSNGVPSKYFEKIETFLVGKNGLEIELHIETD